MNWLESVRLLQSSGVPHELRTTAVPGLVELTDIQAVGEWLGTSDAMFSSSFARARL